VPTPRTEDPRETVSEKVHEVTELHFGTDASKMRTFRIAGIAVNEGDPEVSIADTVPAVTSTNTSSPDAVTVG
jgi:hypothetical protein